MSDILIKGLELPKKGNIGLLLYSDGSVEICGTGSLSKPLFGVPFEKAVALPPHGRLIDADEFKASIHMNYLNKFATNRDVQVLYKLLNEAPTVLEVNT